tara:strand:- start:59 stop:415 length:357 start_codon:yes stop_codon:yes gene_type:complete
MHEVRVPLNTVHLGVEALAQIPEHSTVGDSSPSNHPQNEAICEIRHAVKTMSNTLDDALSFAAVEEGQFDQRLVMKVSERASATNTMREIYFTKPALNHSHYFARRRDSVLGRLLPKQ